MIVLENCTWQDDWAHTMEKHAAWWQQRGTVLYLLAPGSTMVSSVPNRQAPFYYLMAGLDSTASFEDEGQLHDAWLNPLHRARQASRFLSDISFEGQAFPFFDTNIGPGNLATFLGAEPSFAVNTVWYHPCIADLDIDRPLTIDSTNRWFQTQKAILQAGVEVSQGRFLVSMPDLVENIDIVASLRGSEILMMDMIERPEVVHHWIAEINQAYFAAFDTFYEIVRTPEDGNVFSAFCIWGPGKTAKVQCDAAAMISPDMFAEFVVPGLTEQCQWLDYSMFHLDGTQCIRHLDTLLQIDGLDAIEWTPQVSAPQGGDPAWYALYRRVLEAGKSVQAINVQPNEVIPLLDAIGTQGVFLMIAVNSQAEAQSLTQTVEAYLNRS